MNKNAVITILDVLEREIEAELHNSCEETLDLNVKDLFEAYKETLKELKGIDLIVATFSLQELKNEYLKIKERKI